MTFKILMDDTLKVIHRSNVRSALNPDEKNLRLDPLEPSNVANPIVKSRHDSKDDGEILPPMPVIDPSELIGHEGPFRASDPEYKSSRYNVLVEWENGEITSEPLSIFGKDDPVTCAVYACEHGLLEEEGWRRFKGIAKREQKMLRMVNQSCYNKTVINTLSTPQAKLHKRHNALSFHRGREAVASEHVTIFHLPGKYNPANILSKHWAYASVWQTMNALLFARGDTWDLLDDECKEE